MKLSTFLPGLSAATVPNGKPTASATASAESARVIETTIALLMCRLTGARPT